MSEVIETIESNDMEIKRSRGRPKKEIINETETVIKKKGRPKKVSENDESLPKKPRGRPKVENACLPGKPKGGRQYFRDYYRSHNAGIMINCPCCNVLTEQFNLRNHIRSKTCAKYAQLLTGEEAQVEITDN